MVLATRDNNILIGIPTKNRDAFLGKTLASLLEQRWTRFDILIMCDGEQEVGSTPMTRLMLDCHARLRQVWAMEGEHKGPPWNHNIALYDPRFRHYEYIARKDDDLFWDRDCLWQLYFTLHNNPEIGAVGGLWFEQEPGAEMHDRKIFTSIEEFESSIYIRGEVGPYNSNWAQRVYHPTNTLFPVQHLYSDCLYRAEAMRGVGGWPEVYSRGVAHCEETDGTYRLYQAGWDLYVNPQATGQHVRAPGGIRTSEAELHAKQLQDLQVWQARLPELREMEFWPTVVLECKHQHGLGGAARQFYHTASLLQSKFGHENVSLHFTGLHYSPEECEEAFGFRYEETPVPEEADVGIVFGHEPTCTLRAKHKLHYCFFPKDGMSDEERAALKQYDAIFGNSRYTCDWMEARHDVEADVIYPCVVPPDEVSDGVLANWKENIILVVSRCVPHKAPLWLMERFVELGLEGYELHVVTSMSMIDHRSYEEVVQAFAEQHESIVLYQDISNEELQGLYLRAKLLWVSSGMLAEGSPATAEHFGYTPVEAWAHRCVPITYDRGGFRETVDERLRWRTKEQLFEITQDVLEQLDISEEYLIAEAANGEGKEFYMPVEVERFAPELYAEYWAQWVMRAHAGCLALQHIAHPEVEDRPIRVAMICDSPFLDEYQMGVTSGFGQVSGQIARQFLKEGFEISAYGLYDKSMPRRSDEIPYDFWPGALDLEGRRLIPAFVQWAEPDVLFMLHAPGELYSWATQLHNMDIRVPTVAYFPIEGAKRLNASVPNLLDLIEFPVTYCHSGAALIKAAINRDVLVAYHGADHADFRPYPEEERQELRKMLGWEDKFVIMNVGSNKRVKNQPILLDAMRILLQNGHDDIVMYLHCKQFDQFTLQGWSLGNIINMDERATDLPLAVHVYFPEDYDKWQAIDYDGREVEAWKYAVYSEEYRRKVLNSLDLIARYNLADLYVDVSSAEGWGLPVLEAVACGVPAVTVDDQMARSEVHSKYCHMLQPKYWDTWHTGSKLAMVDPQDVAAKILELKENAELRLKYAEAGANVLTDLPWESTANFFVDLVQRAYALRRG